MCVQLMTLTFVCLCVASCLGNLRNHRTQYRNMDQFTNMLGPQIQEVSHSERLSVNLHYFVSKLP